MKYPDYTPNPIFKGLPVYLKDPANYEKIEMAIYDSMALGGKPCSHSEMLNFGTCKKCDRRLWARREMMRKLGFRDAAQYMEWKKVIHEMKGLTKKVALPKYNKKDGINKDQPSEGA